MGNKEPNLGNLIEITCPKNTHCHKDTHWAIYVGDGYVFHPKAREAKNTCDQITILKKEQLNKVVGSCNYWVNNKHHDKYPPPPPGKIIQQVQKLVRQKVVYNLRKKNCEHFTNELRFGVSHCDQPEPKPGDLIEIFRPVHTHWAIYVGDGYVVHLSYSHVANTWAASNNSILAVAPIVKKELLYKVAGRHKYQVNNKHDDKYFPLLPKQIIQGAENLVGQLSSENCEHFVKDLRYGVPRSDRPRPQPGDLIEIFRHGLPYNHWAIYVGDGYVVHLVPLMAESGSASFMHTKTAKGIVMKEMLYEVAGRDKYQVNNKHDKKYSPLPPNEIVQRAEKVVGKKVPYNVMHLNCEHFANSLRYGVPRSDQVSYFFKNIPPLIRKGRESRHLLNHVLKK